MEPYYSDDHVTLHHGDMREVLPALELTVDAVVTDPPYGETSLAWDRWVDGWPALVAQWTSSMWCFGSMRMFTDHWSEFAAWRLSQDVVWEKHNGSGFAADRLKRVHELALHFYRNEWSAIHSEPPRIPAADPFYRRAGTRAAPTPHIGDHTADNRTLDSRDGTRLQRSVIYARSCQGRAIHPTEKPAAILAPLIEYAVPPGGLVLDPFAGSASTLLTARQLGRRAVGFEASEEYCEKAADATSAEHLNAIIQAVEDHLGTAAVDRLRLDLANARHLLGRLVHAVTEQWDSGQSHTRQVDDALRQVRDVRRYLKSLHEQKGAA